MRDPKGVKLTLLVLCVICLTAASGQDVVQQNETKTVDLQDPEVDGTVKSALENGSVSEVVVRKDLLLFPVNAPNLVIAHRQEIHAVPQTNGSNETDGKPTGAQVAEVNEYSLSQVVSSNDTDNENGTQAGGTGPLSASPFSTDTQNSTVLAAGKLLEIPSGFNLTDGLATEKVPLPDEVQNISVPKQSIVDILSKSLAQQDTTMTPDLPSSYEYAKRSIDSSEEDGDDSSDSASVEHSTKASGNTTGIAKRSVDSDESLSVDILHNDSSTSSTSSTTEGSAGGSTSSSTSTSASTSTSTASSKVEKRSVMSDDDGDDDSPNSTDYYDQVKRPSKRNASDSLTPSSQLNEGRYDPNDFREERKSLREDSPEDMDAAEDIVFRPLFRYRQETQLRRQSSNARRRGYSDYGGDYGNQDGADYD